MVPIHVQACTRTSCSIVQFCPVLSSLVARAALSSRIPLFVQAGIAFCVVFAVNSAVHSYLVLRYADGNRVAVNVGFYYCSNAAGRLTGARRLSRQTVPF
jgi:hypothetical protein